MNKEVKSLPLVLWLSVLAIGTGFGEELNTAPKDMAENSSLETMEIQYKGPLVSDTCIPGEGKSEGIAPEISSCVQASRHRWIILFGTVDPRGHDINRSIFYQIRRGAPNGEILKEGIIEKAKSDWDPLGVGHSFRKINAVVKVFGVPKGALRNGKPISTANHFVAKWYIRPCIDRKDTIKTTIYQALALPSHIPHVGLGHFSISQPGRSGLELRESGADHSGVCVSVAILDDTAFTNSLGRLRNREVIAAFTRSVTVPRHPTGQHSPTGP
jgi:hypothetical protein